MSALAPIGDHSYDNRRSREGPASRMPTRPSSVAKSDVSEAVARRVLGPALDLRLYRADALLAGELSDDLDAEEERALTEIANWLDGFVSRAHPGLGRSGEVCPWTRRTM